MSFSPPTTFADGTVLTSAALEGNLQALRVYLHSGIVSSDVQSSQWIDTRHIQPPQFEPFAGLQHGVSGQQGGSDSGMVRLTFCTKYRSGGGRTSSNTFHLIPGTAIELDMREDVKVLFHYWYEIEAGPDVAPGAGTESAVDRLVWVCPYVGPVSSAASTFIDHAQEVPNNVEPTTGTFGWRTSAPEGAKIPYTLNSAYQSRDGTLLLDRSAGRVVFGLAAHSQIDRAGVVNWGVSIESYYF